MYAATRGIFPMRITALPNRVCCFESLLQAIMTGAIRIMPRVTTRNLPFFVIYNILSLTLLTLTIIATPLGICSGKRESTSICERNGSLH